MNNWLRCSLKSSDLAAQVEKVRAYLFAFGAVQQVALNFTRFGRGELTID